MSALLHPVGPESEQTYWVRRAVVIGVLVVVLALVVWLVQSALGRQPGAGAPPTTPASTPAVTASSTPGMSSASTPMSPRATTSGSVSAGTKTTGGVSSATPRPSSSSPKPSGPLQCDPRAVTLALTGDRRVTSGKNTTFRLRLTNTGDTACVQSFTKNPVIFVITSGTDRVWTSAHCAGWVPKGNLTLKPSRGWDWASRWTTQRSAPECSLRDDYLRPGTYVATASIDGGQSVRWVFQVVG